MNNNIDKMENPIISDFKTSIQPICTTVSTEYNESVDGYIIMFDLKMDNSINLWNEFQPQVSTVVIKNGFVTEYNIRIGKIDGQLNEQKLELEVLNARPPKLDKFDLGHSAHRTQPHIRMFNNKCDPHTLQQFLHRLDKALTE